MVLMKLTYRFHEGVLAVGAYTGKEVQVLNQGADYETALSLGWLPEQTAHWQAEHCYQWQRLPLVISQEFRTLDESKLFTILLHHLNNPAEARALAGPVAKKLPKFLGRGSWMITSSTLDDLIMTVFIEARERIAGKPEAVVYLGGERRDTLRQLQ
jgi:hypothetical protein